MQLDLTSIKKAINSLSKAISVCQKAIDDADNFDLIETLKAGVIKNFEFTYELSWKLMKRWIENNVSTTIVDGVTRQELFRVAAESKLICDVEQWMSFHKKRNISSHTYDENNANEVFAIISEFLREVVAFLKVLEEKNQ